MAESTIPARIADRTFTDHVVATDPLSLPRAAKGASDNMLEHVANRSGEAAKIGAVQPLPEGFGFDHVVVARKR